MQKKRKFAENTEFFKTNAKFQQKSKKRDLSTSPINELTQNINIYFRTSRKHQTFREIFELRKNIFAKFCIFSKFRFVFASFIFAKKCEILRKSLRNATENFRFFPKRIVCWKPQFRLFTVHTRFFRADHTRHTTCIFEFLLWKHSEQILLWILKADTISLFILYLCLYYISDTISLFILYL